MQGTCADLAEEVSSKLLRLGFAVNADEIIKNLPAVFPHDNIKRANDLISEKGFAEFVKPLLSSYPSHEPWTLAHAKNFMSLYAAEKKEKTGIPQILTGADFIAFVNFMHQTYRNDVLVERRFGLDIYQDPALLARWRDPKNAELYPRLDKIFSFTNTWVDIEELERIGRRKSLDQELEKVQHLIQPLAAFYPERYKIGGLFTLNNWLRDAEDPQMPARIKAFTEPNTVDFDVFVRKHFNTALPIEDHAIALARAFGKKPEELLIFKKHWPDGQIPFSDNVNPAEIKEALAALGEKPVQKMVERLKPIYWNNLATTIRLARHPNAKEILSVVDMEKNSISFFDAERAMEIFENRVARTNLKHLKKECPGLRISWGSSDFLRWLGKDSATKLLQKGEVGKIYNLLRGRWKTEDINGDDLMIFLEFPRSKRDLLDNNEFHKKVMDTHSFLATGKNLSLYDLEHYLAFGPEGLDIFLSPKSRSFAAKMRKLDPHFGIITPYELNKYRKILILDDIRPLLDLLDSGIIGAKGLVKQIPSIADFEALSGKRFSLPFLKKLAGGGSVSISSIRYLPELSALSEVPRAAEALAHLSQILGHPLRDETDMFGERPSIDELNLAEQLARQEGAAVVLG